MTRRRGNGSAGQWVRIAVILLFVFLALPLFSAVTIEVVNSDSAAASTSVTITNHAVVGNYRYLLLEVAMNVSANPASVVNNITYGAVPFASWTAIRRATTNSRRIEIWGLANPPLGTNNLTVTVSSSAQISAAALTLNGVDPTTPVGANAAAGNTNTAPTITITPTNAGMVLDVLAIRGSNTVTAIGANQVQVWTDNSGTGNNNVRGNGTYEYAAGGTAVTMSETLSSSNAWEIGAVAINAFATVADLSITGALSPDPVTVGSNTTLTFTIENHGPAPASSVSFSTNGLPTNLSGLSASSSVGSCTIAANITCPLGTIANGASVTVTIAGTGVAAGTISSTGNVTATEYDPYANSSFIAIGAAQTLICANPGRDGAGVSVAGIVNTYFAPSAAVTLSPGAKTTTVTLSAGVGAANGIAVGDLLIIMQMQDASINSNNDERYGAGLGTPGGTNGAGSGYTNLNSAGRYEYVVATSAVAFGGGAVLQFTGSGAGGGLLYTYTQAAFVAGSKGQSRFQIIRVPQYTSATLGNGGNVAVATPWNGTVGGVFAIDVSGILTLNGTVNVNAAGFRGAGGRVLAGDTGASTDYRTASSNDANGGKGEGIAGMPQYMISGTGTLVNSGTDGYPNGSYARGAPGDAGGGGTDGDPPANDQNTGGGGGGNGGAGGTGGNSWNSNLAVGGIGGVTFPATVSRVALGGGGGAGTTNNGTSDPNTNTTGINSSGGTGGGIVIIRASEVAGTGTISANGANTLNVQNDSTGGGGAGGTVLVIAQHSGLSGLTVVAHGGNGGTAWATQGPGGPCPGGPACNYHGPGGGGGGGVVILSSAPASADVSGGLNGTTTTAAVAYGATPGDDGVVITNATAGGMGGGISSGAQCVPDLTIGGSGLGSLIRGSNWTYNLSVSNLGLTSSSGQVQVNDTLPYGLSATSVSGTGWTCNQSGPSFTCTRSDALGGSGASYPAIAVNGSVTQSAPDAMTNTATTSGGGETYLANDSTTVNPTATSVADVSLTSTASPNLVAPAGVLTYTQKVTNSGLSDASGLFFTSVLPANTTFQSITVPTGWSCTTPAVGSTGTISCIATSLASGASSTFTIVTSVNNGVSNGTILTNTARVGALTSDPVASNNFTQTSVIVGTAGQSDLALTNVAVPTTAAVGNQVTFTHVLTYTGPSNATSLVYTEPVPANTTLVTLPNPGGSWSCSGTTTVTCTVASMVSGATFTFATVVQITGGTTITDTATIASTPADTYPANNTASASVNVASSGTDLSVADQASPVNVEAGNTVVFSHTVTNNGPNVSGTVTMTDTLPAGTTFQSFTAPSGWSCSNAANVVTCTASGLAVGSAASIEVITAVPTNAANGTILTDSVTVANSGGDPVPGNNTATATSTVIVATDLGVSVTGSPDPVLTTGGPLAITTNVTNNGPTNAGSTTFKITVPANTTYVSLTNPGGGWSCNPPVGGVIFCSIADLPVGYNQNFVLNLTVPALPANTTITSTSTITTNVISDKIPANNTAVFTTIVAAATQTELALSLTSTPVPVTAGTTLTINGVVTNKGPSAAANPTLTFPIPPGTTLSGSTVPGFSCSVISGTLTCTSATPLAIGSINVQFVLNVNSSDTAAIAASSTVSSTTLGPNGLPATATGSTITPVITLADLSVSDTCTPDQSVNNNIVCSQVITDLGPSDAQGVVLTEAVPANTTFVSATGASCGIIAGTITCNVGTVAVGMPVTITFTTKINAGVVRGTKITDTVNVSTTTSDPVSTNNSASAMTTVALATDADIAVTNTPSATTILAGNNITYTQKIANNGPAASAALTINESTPPNTTFVSITPGAWVCSGVPPVGGTGSFNCTLAAGLAANATSTVTMVLKTNAGTAPGTVVTDVLTSPALAADPDSTNNSANASTTIADPNQADVSVTISGNTTVRDGMSTSFTIVASNAGPATATNTIVTIPLPNLEQFVSISPPAGCSLNGNTVTCALGSLASGANVTLTLVVNAINFGVTSNSVSILADQTDPNLSNNTASIAMLILTPTEVKMVSFDAGWSGGQVVLKWQTKEEVRNLGFNVYREIDGALVKLNPSLIAGSAVRARAPLPQHTASAYTWIDPAPNVGSRYWLEDVSLSGARTMHGPVQPSGVASRRMKVRAEQSRLLSDFRSGSIAPSSLSLTITRPAMDMAPDLHDPMIFNGERAGRGQRNAEAVSSATLAGRPAVRIAVNQEAWYRVTQAQLASAGLDPDADLNTLRLITEGTEIPIRVLTNKGTLTAIEFYGIGLDDPYTDTRIYWLIWGDSLGQRIQKAQKSDASFNAPGYLAQAERHDRTFYFAALTNNGDQDNFFGDVVTASPLDEHLQVTGVNQTDASTAQVDITLQGVTDPADHDVKVALNGVSIGEIVFSGMERGALVTEVPVNLLQEGENIVTLTPLGGDNDVTLVDHIIVTYLRTYTADHDQLRFTVLGQSTTKVTGFSSAEVYVIKLDSHMVEVQPKVTQELNGTYSITFSNSNVSPGVYYAYASTVIAQPLGMSYHAPISLSASSNAADLLIVSHSAFIPALGPLVAKRQQQGLTVKVVDIDDVYSEFNYDEHSPYALRTFLQTAVTNWSKAPRWLVLVGDASVDPRNFLGLGSFDYVPTKIVSTAQLKTASDAWFTDFDDSGLEQIPTGRLPVRTLADANTVVNKLLGYEAQSTGTWSNSAYLIADRNVGADFQAESAHVATMLPPQLTVTALNITDPTADHAGAINQLNAGNLIVNYLGHGSVQDWSSPSFFNATDATSLTNGSMAPFVVTMDCFNGLFQDVYQTSLAESLLLAPNGGAIAVWGSSALTDSTPQFGMDEAVMQYLFANPAQTIGEATRNAKQGVTDPDVRRSWILFGDPSMKLKSATGN